ncbi:Potassium voltage-gated channel protein Shab [Halotydeus destructor]|nr:Potassium voltage-gated channel protein Shab [Halotydeus destructor]
MYEQQQMYDASGYASTSNRKRLEDYDKIYDKGYASSGCYSMTPANVGHQQASGLHYQSTPALSQSHPSYHHQAQSAQTPVPQHQVPPSVHHQQQHHHRPGHRHQDYKMLVNVGGVRHEILWLTIEKFPNTRLGRLQECRTEDAILSYCDHYSYEDNEYFFDKNPRIFAAIISCYRTGKLHIPDEFCLTELVTELRYWGFDESLLDMCCQQKYRGRKILYQEMRNDLEMEMFQHGYGSSTYPYGFEMYDERFGVGQCAVYRKFLYDSYENPRIARTTKVLPMISIVFSVLAVVAVALNSVLSIQERDKFGNVSDNVLLSRIIMACVAWISIEYVLRLFSSPNVARFMFDFCNIVDLLGCGLYFYTLLQSTKPGDRLMDLWRLYLMLRSWRIPFLICKLLYEPSALRMDTEILRNFNKQFAILMLFFLTGVVMLSSAIYTAEKDDPTSPFTSIPESFWYTIAALTTTGNTSIHPVTPKGKYFGALASIVGVLFLAAVITISNFARVLQNFNASRQQQSSINGTGSAVPIKPGTTNAHGANSAATYPGQSMTRGSQSASHPHTTQSSNHPMENPHSSYHHITFTDDLGNSLGSIDALVERDRKASRDLSHSSNKVKTITLKIKLDPAVIKPQGALTSLVTKAHPGSGTLAHSAAGGATAADRSFPPAMV